MTSDESVHPNTPQRSVHSVNLDQELFQKIRTGHHLIGWTGHFIVKINEGQSRRVRCMAEKCNEICDEGKFKSLVSAKYPVLAEKFDCFLLQSYIDINKKVKWSHSIPHCGNELRVHDDQYCEVECACGLQTAVLL
ncbi:hypothetical protein POM88_023698 [Heracleum sosnowskyi]|uniref:Uncharacterized protein n=1 Tax=Heracleum sosnowskyi TaxID=360622 RepID=A0AAD8IJZ6_9APIA|nr:hypothetical protein POM88_023698 [Heracleum sosnowskyi]